MKNTANILIGVFAFIVGIFLNKALPGAIIPVIVLFLPFYLSFLFLKRKMTNWKAFSIAARGCVCYVGIIAIIISSYYIIITPDAEYSAAGIPVITNSSNLEDAWFTLKIGLVILITGIFLFIGINVIKMAYKLFTTNKKYTYNIGYGLLFSFAFYEYWNDQHVVAAIIGIGALISINIRTLIKK